MYVIGFVLCAVSGSAGALFGLYIPDKHRYLRALACSAAIVLGQMGIVLTIHGSRNQ